MPATLVLMTSGFLVLASQAPGRSAGPQQRRDYETFNVCQAMPGETIARAVGGKLAEARLWVTAPTCSTTKETGASRSMCSSGAT